MRIFASHLKIIGWEVGGCFFNKESDAPFEIGQLFLELDVTDVESLNVIDTRHVDGLTLIPCQVRHLDAEPLRWEKFLLIFANLPF